MEATTKKTIEVPIELMQEIRATLGMAYGISGLLGADKSKRIIGDTYTRVSVLL